ncbi:astrotactin 2 [Phyllostomus discolor]|uniref:Astrotactin 2 n=1 Tax=Phyllostomus discolor TaxID=89673 RepID=A0A834ENA5_9CHIR|nr:astrotactin 2 [Phyllostomus discolor]
MGVGVRLEASKCWAHAAFSFPPPGDIRYDEAMGYPMVQQWRVRSNLYRVKLSTITLSAGFTNVLKILTKESSREELLTFIQHYGSHYIAEALYGSELTCIIHFPSKKVQQQLWLQYQKGTQKGSRCRDTRYKIPYS